MEIGTSMLANMVNWETKSY